MPIHSQGIQQILDAIRINRQNIAAYSNLGNIRVTAHPCEPLLIFNYTEKATYEGTWNDVEKVSRGLIINYITGTVTALPFSKFFNLEERPETSLSCLPDELCEITLKMDGTLGILYWTQQGPEIATRGSFTSPQAQWATRHLRKRNQLATLPQDIQPLLLKNLTLD